MSRNPKVPAYRQGNTPLYTLVTTVFLVAATFVAFQMDNKELSNVLIGLIVTTVPSVIAAGFSERASRDIRNGVVAEKALEGSTKALEISGLLSGLSGEQRDKAVSDLTRLLESRRERDTLDALLMKHFKEIEQEGK